MNQQSSAGAGLAFGLGGIPVVFFTLALLRLPQAFLMPRTGEPRSRVGPEELTRSSSRYAAAGVGGCWPGPWVRQ